MTVPIAITRFAEEELARAPALADHVVQSVIGVLTQPDPNASATGRIQSADLAQSLARHRPRMVAAYSTALRERVASDLALDGAQVDAAPVSTRDPRKLSLVDEESVSADVEIARATQAIRNVTEHELRELATFLSTLAGEPHVLRDHNPMRPESHARALWAAATALPEDGTLHAVFMRHASAPLAQLLRKAYAAACSRLEDAGIEPAAYRTVILPAGMRTGRSDMLPAPATIGAHRTPAVSANQPLGPTHPGSRASAAAHEVPAESAPVLTDLARTLSALAHTLLDALPASAPSTRGGALAGEVPHTRGGATTLSPASTRSAALPAEPPPAVRRPEFVQRLFDAALTDRRLPADIRKCLERIRPLLVQLVATDAALVERDDHPAWQLIDRIAWQGDTLPEAPDRERLRTVQVIEGLIAQLEGEDNPDATRFSWARDRLSALERNRFERRIARQSDSTAALAAAELQLAAAGSMSALDFGALSTVPSQLYDAAPGADDGSPAGNAWLDERTPGDIARLFIDARWVHAQLLWRGARREIWLWADCRGNTAWPFRRGALRRLRDEGLAQSAQARSVLRDAALRLDAQARRRQAA